MSPKLELVLSFDSLSRVDGSARFGFGSYPQFLTSVSGPIEVRLASEHPSQCTIEVNVRPLTNVPGTESKRAAVILKEVLQREIIMQANPRTLVQFVVQSLVPSPKVTDELMAAMINSCTMSLLNAGSVPMQGAICAVSVGRLPSADNEATYVVQPAEDQASRIDAGGCFAFLFSHRLENSHPYSLSCIWTNWRSLHPGTNSSVAENSLGGARDVAQDAAREVWERFKAVIDERENPKPLHRNMTRSKDEKMDDDDEMEIY